MFSRGPSRRLVGDSGGSVHIVEVMIVGILMMGAVVAVITLGNTVNPPERVGVPVEEDKAGDVLDLLRALPARNTSVHHTHRLEELMLQHMAGDQETLRVLLRSHYSAEHRMVLQVGPRNHVVVGPYEIPDSELPTGDSTLWYSRLGTTLIRPLVSHQDVQMDAHFELLPVWVDRLGRPHGHTMDIQADLSRTGGDPINRSVSVMHRLPLAGQYPFVLEPQTPGGSSAWVTSESQVTNGTTYEWDVQLRIDPTGNLERTWLGAGHVFRVVPPPHWDLVWAEDSWTVISDSQDPVQLLEYTGRPMRDEGTAWLNVSLERDASSLPLKHHEMLRIETVNPAGGEVSMVLSPGSVDHPSPVLVTVSQPSPYPADQQRPVVFTLTNPTSQSLTLERFQVRFEMGHQLTHTPASWSRTMDGDAVIYEYTGSFTLSAGQADTLSLPMITKDTLEGDNVVRDQPPVLEYLGEGSLQPPVRDGLLPAGPGESPERFVGLPGDNGLFHAWLLGDGLESGTHTVRVGHEADYRIPPGKGTFERVAGGTDGFLPGLLEQRLGMRLLVDTPRVAPGDDVAVRLDTGSLRDYLMANEDKLVEKALVRFEVRAGDLVGHVTGSPETTQVLERTPANLEGEIDLGLEFLLSSSPGPVVIDARLVIETIDHGEIALNFLAHAQRSTDKGASPVFMNAHLQFWLPEGSGWQTVALDN